MEYPLLIFTILNLALVATHAALPPDLYWKSVLPTTPMPKAISDILHPGKGSATDVNVGYGKEGGVSMNTGHKWIKPANVPPIPFMVYGSHAPTSESKVHDDPSINGGKGGVSMNTGHNRIKPADVPPIPFMVYGSHAPMSDSKLQDDPNIGGGKGGVLMNTGQEWIEPANVPPIPFMVYGRHAPTSESQQHDDPNIGGEKGEGVSVNTGHKRIKPANVPPIPFMVYGRHAPTLHVDPILTLPFLEKDLHPGAKLNVQFTKSLTNNATFFPREVADSIPFSSNKVQDIFNELSVQPGSQEAHIIQNTIKDCEEPAIRGEEKYCATSLESMVDFSISKLGKNVEVVSTSVDEETRLQEYTVAPGVKKIARDTVVVCHKTVYPYAVFYCHLTTATKAFSVPLVGADGTRVKAVAVCHNDTSQWDPKHVFLQVLKVKPGTPVCHFIPEDNIVWVPK